MTANYLPWLALLAIVIASLIFKGYVKLPNLSQSSGPKGGPIQVQQGIGPIIQSHGNILDGLDSHTLGLAFAKAKRLEAELEVAHAIATQAGEQIKAAFSAPFSAPAPAGPATPPASAPQ